MAGEVSLPCILILTVCTYSQVFQAQKIPDQCGQPYTMITVENSTLPNNTVFRLERDGMRTDFESQLFEKLISCLQTDTTSKKCTFESSRVATGWVYEYKVEAVLATASGNTNVQQGQYYTCQIPLHTEPREKSLCTRTNSSPCFTDPMYCIIINLQNTAQDGRKYNDVKVIWISETKEDLTAYYDATYVTVKSCESQVFLKPTTETTEKDKKDTEDIGNVGVIAGVICAIIVIAVIVVFAVWLWRRKSNTAGSNSPDKTDEAHFRTKEARGTYPASSDEANNRPINNSSSLQVQESGATYYNTLNGDNNTTYNHGNENRYQNLHGL